MKGLEQKEHVSSFTVAELPIPRRSSLWSTVTSIVNDQPTSVGSLSMEPLLGRYSVAVVEH